MQKQNDIFSYFTNPKVDIRSLLKSNDISSDVQKHLVKVYTTLCMTFAASMLGVFLDSMLHLGGLLTSLASFGVLISIRMVSIEKYALRMNMLMAYGALLGMSTGSLVKLAWHVDKSIIITALLSSGAMFGCFTCSALFAKRRSMLFLGGILSSALMVMMGMSLVNMFFQSQWAALMKLYMGLFVFAGYVVYDTQVIIERASMGDRDSISHAVQLFTDFVQLFIRIVIILLRNAEKKQNDQRRKQRRY